MFLGDCVTEYESCEDKKNWLSQVNRRENTNWIVWHINNFQAKPSSSLQWELWPEVGRGEVGPGFSFAKHGFEDGNVQKNASKGRGGRGGAILLPHPKMWYGWTHVWPDRSIAMLLLHWKKIKAERALSRFGKILFLSWNIYGQHMTFFQGWSGKNHPNIATETSPDLCC